MVVFYEMPGKRGKLEFDVMYLAVDIGGNSKALLQFFLEMLLIDLALEHFVGQTVLTDLHDGHDHRFERFLLHSGYMDFTAVVNELQG